MPMSAFFMGKLRNTQTDGRRLVISSFSIYQLSRLKTLNDGYWDLFCRQLLRVMSMGCCLCRSTTINQTA